MSDAQESRLVCVYETQGILTGEIIKGKLETAGIPVLLAYESAGIVIGVTVNGLGKVRVLVPADWEAEALALIDEGANDDDNRDDSGVDDSDPDFTGA